jgi:hypothetical protein
LVWVRRCEFFSRIDVPVSENNRRTVFVEKGNGCRTDAVCSAYSALCSLAANGWLDILDLVVLRAANL